MRLIKASLFTFFALAICVNVNAQKKDKKKKDKTETNTAFEVKNNIDSVSYCVGMSVGLNMIQDFSEANKEAVIQGLRDALDKADKLIPEEDIPAILNPYFQKKQIEAQEAEQKELEKIKVAGEKFLEENKKKKGVVTTESGLQYIVLKEGEGKQPTATSNVTVHYHGTTTDGTVFDSSVERNQPASFGLNQVIPGWTEGVQLMKEGAKYKFFIPQELAYGANPRPGGPIKPYMPLIFEVELISINDNE